ncbi:hypothetical protein, partial [Thauera aromatica]|uniref:hypothetical protein n=1 Tax=Thauera aromatica TaxID=59405 RepID=UPI001FFDE871
GKAVGIVIKAARVGSFPRRFFPGRLETAGDGEIFNTLLDDFQTTILAQKVVVCLPFICPSFLPAIRLHACASLQIGRAAQADWQGIGLLSAA